MGSYAHVMTSSDICAWDHRVHRTCGCLWGAYACDASGGRPYCRRGAPSGAHTPRASTHEVIELLEHATDWWVVPPWRVDEVAVRPPGHLRQLQVDQCDYLLSVFVATYQVGTHMRMAYACACVCVHGVCPDARCWMYE